jgi:hypothetical protein
MEFEDRGGAPGDKKNLLDKETKSVLMKIYV